MSHHFQEILEYAGLNAASWIFVFLTFRWDIFIPPPERIIEWSIGLLVGVSIVVLNLVKFINEYRKKNDK